MISIGHSIRAVVRSLRSTMSPTHRSGTTDCHLVLDWSVCKYSFFQRSQKIFAKCWTHSHCALYKSLISCCTKFVEISPDFCVSNMFGLRITGDSGSEHTCAIGLEFTMAHTSAIRVVNTSWVRCLECKSISIESSILLAMPIIRSHTPPMWEECRGLKIHVTFWSDSYLEQDCLPR